MKLNKKIFGWIMYDFANSSFTTIIVTVVFSVYFKNVIVNAGELGTALWGRAVSISMLFVAISAPIFGAIADFSRAKKKFLFYNTYLTIIFTALLFFVKPGEISKGMWFFIIANFGFNSANVFYNSLLPDIVGRKDLGKVSGWGWATGYVGGLVSLLLILPLVNNRLTEWVFPTVALFFLVFSGITFVLLKSFVINNLYLDHDFVSREKPGYPGGIIASDDKVSTGFISFFFQDMEQVHPGHFFIIHNQYSVFDRQFH